MTVVKKPTVKLVGEDGNAFLILGKVQKALKESGYDEKYIDGYLNEAMSGGYDNLIHVTMKYVNVQ